MGRCYPHPVDVPRLDGRPFGGFPPRASVSLPRGSSEENLRFHETDSRGLPYDSEPKPSVIFTLQSIKEPEDRLVSLETASPFELRAHHPRGPTRLPSLLR